MVLRLKTRESRSPPGPPSTGISDQGSEKHAAVTSFAIHAALRWHLIPVICPLSCIGAGWSSPVARQAHNLKVVGSNPTPATKTQKGPRRGPSAFLRGTEILRGN